MKILLPRRTFLQTAGLTAAGYLVTCPPAGANGPEGAARPRPRLLTGCCAYSYRKYLESGKMTMEDFILKAVELAVDGVDVTTYWLKSTDPAYLVSLRHLAFKHGVPFSGAAIGTEMCQSDPDRRAAEIAKIKKWVDATELLGALAPARVRRQSPAGRHRRAGSGVDCGNHEAGLRLRRPKRHNSGH